MKSYILPLDGKTCARVGRGRWELLVPLDDRPLVDELRSVARPAWPWEAWGPSFRMNVASVEVGP
jgi:hypothetical protein